MNENTYLSKQLGLFINPEGQHIYTNDTSTPW